ncbi:MAG: protein kinase [Proteobacteria bacterium]|nr:protein kinase [Pseudomonadota bacterium]
MTFEEGVFTGTKRYAIRHRIGGGATGIVYEAYDRKRDAIVALKTLRSQAARHIYRLKKEFRSLADLHHPNLVTLYELEGSDDGWFIVMELVDGVNFFNHVRGGQRSLQSGDSWSLVTDTWLSDVTDITEDAPEPPPPGAAKFCPDMDRLRATTVQLLRGVAELHRVGKLHRDLKPSNVLITKDERVILVDFGLIYETDRNESEQSRIDNIVGTAAFMSPEQALGRSPTAASDMYSVGTMLYLGLLGILPFAGSPVQIILERQRRDPPAPTSLIEGIPEDLNQLVVKLLSRNPDERPTAREALVQLGEEPKQADEAPDEPIVGGEGREAQRQVLEDAWVLARRGRAVVVNLKGKSGVGKTALVRTFIKDVRRRERAWALEGRCFERESVPYKVFDALIDGVRRRLRLMSHEERQELLPKDMFAMSRLFPVFEEFLPEEAGSTDEIRGRRATEVDSKHRFPVLESRPTEPAGPGVNGEIDPVELRQRAFQASADFLANICRKQPIIFFLDDVQWGDLDSARLLSAWLQRLQRHSILVIVSYRSEDEESSEFLNTFLRDSILFRGETKSLALEELPLEKAQIVARGLIGDSHPRPAEAAVWVAKQSGGNAFLMVELVKQLALAVEQGDMDFRSIGLKDLLPIDSLTDEARRLLLVVALAGRPLPLPLLAQAADVEDRLTAVTILRARHFVRTSNSPLGEFVELYHNRIGDSIRQRTDRQQKSKAHLRLAEAMEKAGWHDPEAMMLHRLNGGQVVEAAEQAIHAAESAVKNLAFDKAARLYRTALSLTDWSNDAEQELTQELAAALVCAGRGEDAAHCYLSLAKKLPAHRSLEMRRNAAEQLITNGHLEEGLTHLNDVLADVGFSITPTPYRTFASLMMARFWLWLRGMHFEQRDPTTVHPKLLLRSDICAFVANAFILIEPIQGARFHTYDLIYSLRSGDPLRVVRALSREMIVGIYYKQEEWTALKRRTREVSELVGRAYTNGLVTLGEGMHNHLLGRFKAAYRLLRQAERVFGEHCQGITFERDFCRVFALRSLIFIGELKSATEQYEQTMSDAKNRGNLLVSAWLQTGVFATLYLANEDLESLRGNIKTILDTWAKKGWEPQHLTYQHLFALRGRIYLYLYEGRNADTWEEHERRWPSINAGQWHRHAFTRILNIELRGRCALSVAASNPTAMKEAQTCAVLLQKEELPWGVAMGQLIKATCLHLEGEKEEPIQLMQEALRTFDRKELGLYAAVTRYRLGQLLKGAEARTHRVGAEGWMYNQNIKNPARLADVFAPGFEKAID